MPQHHRTDHIELEVDELRTIAAYAADCAERVLPIHERADPNDGRPRKALAAARRFASGGGRTQDLRTVAMAAFRAARDARTPAAAEVARAASAAAAAAYLHPLASADQVKHILGAAAHAARAIELDAADAADAADDPAVGAEAVRWAIDRAPPAVVAVLARYPPAPSGGGRVGELMRAIDGGLRRGPNAGGRR